MKDVVRLMAVILVWTNTFFNPDKYIEHFRQIHLEKGGMKDVVRLVAVILVCQLPPFPRQLPPETSAENTRELMVMMIMIMMQIIMLLLMMIMIIIIIIIMIFQKTTPVRYFRRNHSRINCALQKKKLLSILLFVL